MRENEIKGRGWRKELGKFKELKKENVNKGGINYGVLN